MSKKQRSIEEIWKISLAQIEVKLDSPTTFRTWFLGTKLLQLEDKSATIGVKHSYAADWINKHHNELIIKTVSYVAGKKLNNIKFKIVGNDTPQAEIANKDTYEPKISSTNDNELANQSLLDLESGQAAEVSRAIANLKLDPEHTFNTLVIGDSNQMAIAAAKAVAKNLAKVYNPFFIYGNPGLGKTHLAQAIAIDQLERNPSTKIIYVPAETFMIQMVNSIRSGRTKQFRDKFRDGVELLIIDDIQFISNWEKTQTEFFNTFNALYSAGKQIVIISDRPPEELENLTPRLKSRFQGGIVVDIERPDFEHRLAILAEKQAKLSTNPQTEIHQENLEYIANLVTDNIRELEGALQKVLLMNNLVGRNISKQEIAKQLGKDIESKRKQITVSEVIKFIAQEYKLKTADIKGKRRTKDIALARQICMYILREELGYKLEEIAGFLNRKDHTTIMHGIDKVKELNNTDSSFNNHFRGMLTELQSN